MSTNTLMQNNTLISPWHTSDLDLHSSTQNKLLILPQRKCDLNKRGSEHQMKLVKNSEKNLYVTITM